MAPRGVPRGALRVPRFACAISAAAQRSPSAPAGGSCSIRSGAPRVPHRDNISTVTTRFARLRAAPPPSQATPRAPPPVRGTARRKKPPGSPRGGPPRDQPARPRTPAQRTRPPPDTAPGKMSGAFGRPFKFWVRRAGLRIIRRAPLEPIPQWNIVKGDTVQVLTGRSSGKTGKVLKVIRRKNRVIVEGLNLVRDPAGGRPRATTTPGRAAGPSAASLHVCPEAPPLLPRGGRSVSGTPCARKERVLHRRNGAGKAVRVSLWCARAAVQEPRSCLPAPIPPSPCPLPLPPGEPPRAPAAQRAGRRAGEGVAHPLQQPHAGGPPHRVRALPGAAGRGQECEGAGGRPGCPDAPPAPRSRALPPLSRASRTRAVL